jgi:hypothetical protein
MTLVPWPVVLALAMRWTGLFKTEQQKQKQKQKQQQQQQQR